ncbi:MAG: PIN domain-containing protein [Verrucomicrobiota bacterium]|jgi:predicted nucleic acid-binding protein
MIHLDTNYLIGLLVKGSAQALEVDGWLVAGQTLAASAVAWTEFLNGPITPLEISQAEAVLRSRIVPFGQPEAVLAAVLFNKTGRRRGSRFDCLIAATAILDQAEVATVNDTGFKVFVPHGLKLAAAPGRSLRTPKA